MRLAVGFLIGVCLPVMGSAFVPSNKLCLPPRRYKIRASQLHNVREEALSRDFDRVEETLGVSTTKDLSSLGESRPMKTLDGVALIAGTAVGGGFLALPSLTSPIGYLPTMLGLTLAYIFLVFSAVAFVEAAGLMDADKQRMVSANQGTSYSSGTSVASVIRHAFGKKWAVVSGLGFLTQMLAVMTAQVVKGAEMLSHLTGMSYRVACVAPLAVVGLFVFASKQEFVEGFNTVLTVVMLGGFAALIAGAIGRADILTGLFQNADWLRLLPNTRVPFAMPVFVKLLAFGEAMPLLVERMALGPARKTNKTGIVASRDQLSAFRRIRKATVLGAGLPLLLAIVWAGISAALVHPSDPNPIISLLGNYGASITVPVLLLSYGAIGTTLLGSLLAMAHFSQDMICSKLGYCSMRWMSVASSLTVVLPSILACVGPSLYFPLLAFAGAYPTTLLYGLAPSLAAITLRRRAENRVNDGGTEVPRLVPGGDRTLVALVCCALGLVGASSMLALRQALKIFV